MKAKKKKKRTSFNLLLLNLKRKQSCQISVHVSQHPSCAHPVPCVITPREWLSRCEGCGWDWIGRREQIPVSPDNWCLLCFGGICAAPVDRAAPHLLPHISCLFFRWRLRPLLQPLPQVSQVHEKAPYKLFSPSTSSWTLKPLLGWSEVDLLPGTSSDPYTVWPASLNIVNLTLYLRAQQLLANCVTHRQFIIPSLFAQTKHWAHIWGLPLNPFILF